MTPKEQDAFFKSDKSDWYSETDDGVRIWNQNIVKHFWDMILIHKINNNDFNFNGFVFPTFSRSEENKLLQGDSHYERIFGANGLAIKEKVNFKNCRFLGNAFFLGNFLPAQHLKVHDIHYLQDLIFDGCIFENEFRLSAVKIMGNLSFNNCGFLAEFSSMVSVVVQKTNYSECTFHNKFDYFANTHKGTTDFSSNIFIGDATFAKCFYEENYNLSGKGFTSTSTFFENTYMKRSVFAALTFEDKIRISDENFKNCLFQGVYFRAKHNILEGIKTGEDGLFIFQDIIFPVTTVFRQCDCRNIKFTDSDIVDVKFSSCQWKKTDRLILKDEPKNQETNISQIESLEELYRQLKKNFDNHKNWELSGMAYISEMEMRKIGLWKERKLFQWFIYWFYGFFGGYTQDIRKPMLSLAVLFLGCSIAYFFIDFDIINAMERGVEGSLPYLEIKEDEPFPDYWLLLKNVQFILSSIFLSFFVLALRKIFKQ
ncbi:hypothetical protein ATE92_1753 [Ulvibacter sp. MAR_2010_11]|uniref:hypothetical protein n=1 Tax=Ulvibacter sp. MAR_2010_11 TaxID=1250229 RepID=UPI000C2BE257|nr:hypothetical protein [Ulvibacter sp. MAR_2010_11]PKA83596.1 hypothetical protein ATE92_1753 [Ulvibacter sp. MAR_2010_11]